MFGNNAAANAAELERRAEIIGELEIQSIRGDTRAKYMRDAAQFYRWCDAFGEGADRELLTVRYLAARADGEVVLADGEIMAPLSNSAMGVLLAAFAFVGLPPLSKKARKGLCNIIAARGDFVPHRARAVCMKEITGIAEKILAKPKGEDAKLRARRNAAMLLLQWCACFRGGEVLSLDTSDLHFGEKAMSVQLRKRKNLAPGSVFRARLAPPAEELKPVFALMREVVGEWLECRRHLPGEALFCDLRRGHVGKRLGKLDNIYRLLSRYAAHDTSSHGLRRGGMQARYYDAGVSLAELGQFVGSTDLVALGLYLVG